MKDYPELLYDEEALYSYVGHFAEKHGLAQTLQALPFARDCHKGQHRDSREHIPYIIHPLQMAKHAIALQLVDDEILTAALLHDVCEDCGIFPEQLPVSKSLQDSVALLTKNWKAGEESEALEKQYYEAIAQDPTASIVKLLDRCNNLSSMADGFSLPRIRRYLEETKTYYGPLVTAMLERYGQYETQIYAICYQMHSVFHAYSRMLKNQKDENV
ncbi:MAG: HD domain-containing protein [Lachnospiraceae bacterium]|nr:HD domain-containing protein [Lachnospiraceae bacterium]